MARAPEHNKSSDRVIATNRRARFNYELTDSYEAGVALIGSEARSLRERAADLTDAWVDIDASSQAWVKGMRIPPMQHAAFGHEERRTRRATGPRDMTAAGVVPRSAIGRRQVGRACRDVFFMPTRRVSGLG
jgi:hypothetical protein